VTLFERADLRKPDQLVKGGKIEKRNGRLRLSGGDAVVGAPECFRHGKKTHNRIDADTKPEGLKLLGCEHRRAAAVHHVRQYGQVEGAANARKPLLVFRRLDEQDISTGAGISLAAA